MNLPDTPELSDWSEWSSCDVACGDGFRSRSRECVSSNCGVQESGCVGELTENECCVNYTGCGKKYLLSNDNTCGGGEGGCGLAVGVC